MVGQLHCFRPVVRHTMVEGVVAESYLYNGAQEAKSGVGGSGEEGAEDQMYPSYHGHTPRGLLLPTF